MKLATLATALFAVTLSACSDPDSQAQPDAAVGGDTSLTGADSSAPGADAARLPFPPGSGTSFCMRTLGATLMGADTCCSTTDKQTSDYRSLLNAFDGVRASCGPAFEASGAAGRLRLDDAAAGACFAAFDAELAQACGKELLSALALLRTPPCRDALVGLQPAGASCVRDYECQPGLTCLAAQGQPSGSCSAPGAIGAACGGPTGAGTPITALKLGHHPLCVTGAHCDPQSRKCVAAQTGACDLAQDCGDGLTCYRHSCVASLGGVGAPCDIPLDCAAGLYCAGPAGSPGTCSAKLGAGSSCSSGNAECQGRCATSAGVSTCVAFCGSR